MFFFCGLFAITTIYFTLFCTVNNVKLGLFNTAAYIKHKIDEPKRLAKLKEIEFERTKNLVDTVTKVNVIFANKEIEITDIFKNEFSETEQNEYANRMSMSMSDFVDIVDDRLDNDIPQEDNVMLYVEYTYLGTTYKAMVKDWVTFPFYIPPKNNEKLFPKRKVLSVLLGNNSDPGENKDITKSMKEYAGPMHTFHSEFGGNFKPRHLVEDESTGIKEIFEDCESNDPEPVDQMIKMVDSKANTYTTSLYDSDFEW